MSLTAAPHFWNRVTAIPGKRYLRNVGEFGTIIAVGSRLVLVSIKVSFRLRITCYCKLWPMVELWLSGQIRVYWYE